MKLAALIRRKESMGFATATPATVATYKGEKARTVATVSVESPPVVTIASASRWWLIHYPDGAPVKSWTDPPATWTEILERHPDAVEAVPINQTAQMPITSCDTCAHATYHGGCGDPVSSGLSDMEGVIVYHEAGGKDCSAFLAIIQPDLEARILAMAEWWNYSGDDLAVALAVARADPAGWRKVLESPCE